MRREGFSMGVLLLSVSEGKIRPLPSVSKGKELLANQRGTVQDALKGAPSRLFPAPAWRKWRARSPFVEVRHSALRPSILCFQWLKAGTRVALLAPRLIRKEACHGSDAHGGFRERSQGVRRQEGPAAAE